MYTNVCKHCKKVFKSRVKLYSCKECQSIDTTCFDSIMNYLKRYPNSNALQISEALGISAFEVLQYMKEGRLCESKGFFEQI